MKTNNDLYDVLKNDIL